MKAVRGGRAGRGRDAARQGDPGASRPAPGRAAAGPAERFRAINADRAHREWRRYEGTAQRALFRELRRRFLFRHPGRGPTLEVGPGPGRFSADLATATDDLVLLDLSREMLRQARSRLGGTGAAADRRLYLRGDGRRAPLRPRSLGAVVAFGNLFGFAGAEAFSLLGALTGLLRPAGLFLGEFAPGTGERSSYLARLPAGAVGRLLAAPPTAVRPRVMREGFQPSGGRSPSRRHFRWIATAEMIAWFDRRGWTVEEVLSVAPCLGALPGHATRVAEDPKAWRRLLALEETVGRDRAHSRDAAAVLIAARAPR